MFDLIIKCLGPRALYRKFNSLPRLSLLEEGAGNCRQGILFAGVVGLNK